MKIRLFFFLSFAISTCLGQATISGIVQDGKGDPIPLSNVFLKDTYDGTTADENGRFQFATLEKGKQILVARSLGYKESEQLVDLNGKAITVTITLQDEISELNAVTISAGAFMASDESRRTVFRAVDIATTAGATADIAGALNTLPGTQKVGESGRLFVRGGDGNEAKTFIDGALVLDAYSPSAPNTPSRGRFLPFMFKGTSFSTGGYSAEYGQALSSILALESKDESEQTRTDIGILSVGGDVAHTQAWEGGSAAAKIQYTNLRPYMGLINQRIDWRLPPVSLEGIGAVHQRFGKNGMAKVYGNFNHSTYSLFNHGIDNPAETHRYDLENNYRYLNGSFKDVLSESWIVRGGVSYTGIANITDVDQVHLTERDNGIHGKIVFDGSLSDHIELKSGAEVIRHDYSFRTMTNNVALTDFTETISAAFAESGLYASNNMVARVGVRGEYNSLQGKAIIDPRISLAYKTGTNGQVSVAYGTFRQSVKNMWLRENTSLGSEKAEHVIANYQRIENNRTFRIETYYKRYTNLAKAEGSQLTNNGYGYAQGVELFWRDNGSVKKLDYWVSYSFLDTKRNYLNFPYAATPSFASKHNVSVVGKYFIQKIRSQLGTTFSVTSGRPYNNPNDITFNGSKTPVYQDLSFNWSYLPKPYLIVYLSCTNVLGRNNIFGYEYGAVLNNGQYNARPIRQAAPRFLFVGIFITLSKDRSVNQLPTL